MSYDPFFAIGSSSAFIVADFSVTPLGSEWAAGWAYPSHSGVRAVREAAARRLRAPPADTWPVVAACEPESSPPQAARRDAPIAIAPSAARRGIMTRRV